MSYYYAQEAKKSNIVHERGHVRLGLEYTRCGKMLGADVGDGRSELRLCKACPQQPVYVAPAPTKAGLSHDQRRRRDLFAAAALPGCCQAAISAIAAGHDASKIDARTIASDTRALADALLAELDKTEAAQ